MKFWDSSALVPLLVPEPMSGSMQQLYEDDPVVIAWWATEIECISAIAQLAAAIFAAEGRPATLEFVSLDDRLLIAARREGFSIKRPAR